MPSAPARRRTAAVLTTLLALAATARTIHAQSPAAKPDSTHHFALRDIFELEWAGDPQISPDGKRVAFVRGGYDIQKDRPHGELWIINADGSGMRPLLEPGRAAGAPRWSPDGTRLLYVSSVGHSADLFVRWMDSGQEAKLTHLDEGPGGIAWSPDGQWIAFTMFVPSEPRPFAQMPSPPAGADWGPPIKFIDKMNYRADGEGYLPSGYQHIFVLPAEGGTPRQITFGDFNDGGVNWTPDGRAILFNANRHENADWDPLNSEVYEVPVAGGGVKALTSRQGPDNEPTISPDGRLIAYTGFDDREQGYQVTHLYVMNRDGSGARIVSAKFDRDIGDLNWSRDGKGVYFQYDDEGITKIGFITLAGDVTTIADGVGGLDLGRPYSGGQYSVSSTGVFAFTQTDPTHPADVAVVGPMAAAAKAKGAAPAMTVHRLTRLNDDLLADKTLGSVEEFRFASSFDQRSIEGWIMKPPGFDPSKKYPLLLEIHGGPFADYGWRYASELQLYAAAGYVVLYTNPRGSTSYGEEFGNLIHHDYPDHDYDDLMSGVDAVIAKGYVDPGQLYVTGGSGGGVLTAWIVGHTTRFRAAVVQKPVINWYSFVLTADGPGFFSKYWFPGFPWDNQDHYMKRSPIAYVGHVKTPTMLITGEVDYRTPSEEVEQFYEALQLLHVPTAMVRIPDASHEIAAKPSNMMAKVAYVLAWFGKYGKTDVKTEAKVGQD